MVHIENIPHLLKHGLVHRTSPNCNPSFVPIGDNSLISTRHEFLLPNGNRLGEYIPFYFGFRMPMLYVIQKGFNNVSAISAEKIVYCITTVADVISCKSIRFLFSDGHAVDALSDFFSLEDIPNIDKIIDRKAINSKYWKDENDLDLKRRKEAEFLLHSDLPVLAIRGYAVYNETAKTRLLDWGLTEKQVVVRPNYYF